MPGTSPNYVWSGSHGAVRSLEPPLECSRHGRRVLLASFCSAPLAAPPAARALPAQPSLEQLRKQAKTLLAEARSGDPAAQQRLERCFPALRPATSSGQSSAPDARQPTLAQALLVIAREHGFLSWTRLRRAVELAPLRAQLERFTERGWLARSAVLQALVEAGAAGVEVVLEGLSHPHPRVRRGAAGFLDHHATDACVPQLTELALHDPVAEVRRTALHTLVCEDCKQTPLQTDGLPLLVQAFRQDPNRRVRFTAALALRGYADQAQVQEAFRAAVREDTSGLVGRAAVGCLRGDAAPPLLAHVAEHDPDPHVRVAAASLIGDDPRYHLLACRVLEAVERQHAKPQVKREAHQALKRLSPEYRQRAAQRARDAHLARAAQPPGAPRPTLRTPGP